MKLPFTATLPKIHDIQFIPQQRLVAGLRNSVHSKPFCKCLNASE